MSAHFTPYVNWIFPPKFSMAQYSIHKPWTLFPHNPFYFPRFNSTSRF
jgi:hypothetical protein